MNRTMEIVGCIFGAIAIILAAGMVNGAIINPAITPVLGNAVAFVWDIVSGGAVGAFVIAPIMRWCQR